MWRERYRCAVTLSVDFDAETLWSGTFNLRTPSPMSRGDYDVRAALPRDPRAARTATRFRRRS